MSSHVVDLEASDGVGMREGRKQAMREERKEAMREGRKQAIREGRKEAMSDKENQKEKRMKVWPLEVRDNCN